MLRKQLRFRRPSLQPQKLAGELAILAPAMTEALLAANEAYANLGIRYALCGGLAAGAYGIPRATKDIDFLIGDEALAKGGIVVSFAKPMPLQAGEVPIDPIPLPNDPSSRAVLDAALSQPMVDATLGVNVPLLSPAALALMKLDSPRRKDRDDIVSMLKTGALDVDVLMQATEQSPLLRQRLEAAIAEFENEEE